jgi:predicted acetyltransferase
MRVDLRDGLWLRLVDVVAALEGRSYDVDGAVVFEVRDDFCPWNEGRWKLADGTATRTDETVDVALPVQSLGAAFLGGISFASLARAGRVEELQDGALARADAMFRWDRHPWCPEIF